MKWLEIIELRTADSNRLLLEEQLKKLITEVSKEAKRRKILVYHRVQINTDFSIHLFHESDNMDSSVSPLGLQIASNLKSYGLVNHSVWVQMNGSKVLHPENNREK